MNAWRQRLEELAKEPAGDYTLILAIYDTNATFGDLRACLSHLSALEADREWRPNEAAIEAAIRPIWDRMTEPGTVYFDDLVSACVDAIAAIPPPLPKESAT